MCRLVLPGSRRFTRSHIGVVVFRQVLVGTLGRAFCSPGSLRFAWVHSSAHRGSRIHSVKKGFTQGAQVSPCSFEFAWVHSGGYSGSIRFIRARKVIVGFNQVLMGSIPASVVVVGFVRVPVDSLRRVYTPARMDSLELFGVKSYPRRRRGVNSGTRGFSRARIAVFRIIRVRLGLVVRA